MGIGSEGYVAIQMQRRFLGVELKRSYWQQAVANLKAAHLVSASLFDGIEELPEEDDIFESEDAGI